MLFCQDGDGPVYVKVGMSALPYRRVCELSTGCPVRPAMLALAHVGMSRGRALKIERGLHRRLDKWRHRREWFLVPIADKAEFKRQTTLAISDHFSAGARVEWRKTKLQDSTLNSLAVREKKAADKSAGLLQS